MHLLQKQVSLLLHLKKRKINKKRKLHIKVTLEQMTTRWREAKIIKNKNFSFFFDKSDFLWVCASEERPPFWLLSFFFLLHIHQPTPPFFSQANFIIISFSFFFFSLSSFLSKHNLSYFTCVRVSVCQWRLYFWKRWEKLTWNK